MVNSDFLFWKRIHFEKAFLGALFSLAGFISVQPDNKHQNTQNHLRN